MGDDKPPLLGLFGIGSDNRIPARVDLHDDLNLEAVVDRLELGGVLLLGQLAAYGLFTDLPVTTQVGLAGLVVIALDLFDRKLLSRWLD
jgi:hypothetical protein